MTIGTAIVVVMCLYLLDKHGLLKRAIGAAGILSALALAWIFGQQQYRKWEYARYTRRHTEMRANLISKYHNTIPAPPAGFKPAPQVQWDDEQRKPATQSVPKLDPSEVESVVYLNDICKEPQWGEMEDWERSVVVEAVVPKMGVFERMQFVDQCH